jgi:hypothetical protein
MEEPDTSDLVVIYGRPSLPEGRFVDLTPRQQAQRLEVNENLVLMIPRLLEEKLWHRERLSLEEALRFLEATGGVHELTREQWAVIGRILDRVYDDGQPPTQGTTPREPLLDRIDQLRTELRLSAWEKDFLRNVAVQVADRGTVSARQMEVIDSLSKRLWREHAPVDEYSDLEDA